MADASNLFDLAASIRVETSQSDRALTDTQRKVLSLEKDFRKLDSATKSTSTALRSDLGNALSTVSPRLGALTAGGLAGAIAGGLTLIAAGAGAAVTGIISLTTHASQVGSELFDLSQKVNFSAETLSTLKVAAELSGGSLASLSTSLGIFDRNLEEAKDQTSEISKVFKALNIDITDNEQALRQSFKALMIMEAGSQQTALAMKLFGRSGKEVLGIIKETDGSVDDFTEKMRELGLVMSTSGAKRADEFGDKLTMLRNKFDAIIRQIGTELMPTVEKAADDAMKWLQTNQGELKKTASELATVVSWVYKLSKAIIDGNPNVIFIRIVRSITDVGDVPKTGIDAGLDTSSYDLQSLNTPGKVPDIPLLSVFRKPKADEFKFTTAADIIRKTQQDALDKLTKQDKKGGGGGRGGGGAQKDILEGLKTSLAGLNTEYRKYNVALLDSASATDLAAEKEKLLSSIMSSMKSTVKARISEIRDVDEALSAAIEGLPKKAQEAARALLNKALAQFKDNQEMKIAGDLSKKAEELTQGWRQEMDRARGGADEYAIAIQELEKEYSRYGLTLDAGTKKELAQLAVMQRELALILSVTRARQVLQATRERFATKAGRDRPPWIDLGGGSTVGGEPGTAERPRIATVEEQALREQLTMHRERMEALASDLTGILDRSIYEGFSQGAARGFATLAQGLLDIVNRIFLARLQEGLTNMLSGLSGGGGNWISRLLGIGGSLLGGAVGGGFSKGGISGGFAGKFESGGVIPMGMWGDVHAGETVKATPMGAQVIPSRGGASSGNTFNVTFQVQDARSLQSRDTQSQVARQMKSLMQKATLSG